MPRPLNSLVPLFLISLFLCTCDRAHPLPDPLQGRGDTTSIAEPAAAPRTDLIAIDTDEALIATARMAAPEASRDDATVIGYNETGKLVTLAEGTNKFICLADDPNRDGFSAACYHENLEPFMARGRELRAEGMSGSEIFKAREEEAKAGTLDMGPAGSALHVYYGPDTQYDPQTGEVPGAKYRYVVYMPFATAESTGLPESPIAPNHPWIMDPGTHTAHIMISPAP